MKLMTQRGALYIRQSAQRDQDTALSASVQTAAGQRLADYDGIPFEKVRCFIDLAKSGGAGKEKLRPDYQRLCKAIENGELDVVYTLTMSRLARSLAELLRFALLCQSKGVVIVSEKEGRYDPRDPMSKAFFAIAAVFAELERDMAVSRQNDNIAERRRRGERFGPLPYGERPGNRVDRVVELFKETGTLVGTARALNAERVPAPMGKSWSPSGLRIILATSAPGLLPATTARGVKPASTGGFRFYQLLRCHCGRIMTGYTNKGKPAYRCHKAPLLADHGRPYIVAESMLVDAVQAELAQVRRRARSLESEVEGVALKIAALNARKAKLDDVYLDGDTISKDEYRRQSAKIRDRIAELSVESRARAIVVPDLTADIEPGKINAVLRDLFHYVELGRDLRPVRFEWAVPEMRLAPLEASA